MAKIRKNFLTLSQAEKDRVILAILQLKKDPPIGSPRVYTYTHFVAWHRIGVPDFKTVAPFDREYPKPSDQVAWHGTILFLAWHRIMLLLFEENLRLADKELNPTSDDNLALPYWDWTYLRSRNSKRKRGVIWKDENFGPTGNANDLVDSGHFAAPGFAPTGNPGWTFTDIADYLPPPIVAPPTHPDNYTAASVQSNFFTGLPVFDLTRDVRLFGRPQKKNAIRKIIEKAPPFDVPPMTGGSVSDPDGVVDSFRNALEGFSRPNGNFGGNLTHNRIHVWIGGSMSGTESSPKDPVFYMHHSYIDYLWAKWQLRRTTDASTNPVPIIKAQNYPSNAEIDIARNPPTSSGEPPNKHAAYLTDPLYPWDGTAFDYKNGSVSVPHVITTDQILNWMDISIPTVSATNIGYRYDDDPLAVNFV